MSVMSSDKAPHYRLTPNALEDLDHIWRYTAETWSITQADEYIDALAMVFATIALHPTMARERAEFSPPVRLHNHQGHVIAYTVQAGEVIVIRILGGTQNWQAILGAIDP
jgi:toxin ParE1/3/4